MRPLETALLGAVLIALASWLAAGWRPAWLRGWPAAALAFLALHLGLEHYRWQMVPAYALTGVLALLALTAREVRPARPPALWRRLLAGLGGLALALAALAPPVVFPVPRLPQPGGPYPVGTTSFHWTDAARAEVYTDAPDDQREIMVQLWYPAAPGPGAERAPWMERLDVAGPTIARYIGLPDFVLDHTGLIRLNAYQDAPLAAAEARYPVVLYSHGWNGFRTVNVDQLEALASHGYIVASIDHTYGAMITVFPDGRVALNRPDALPDDALPEAEAQALRERLAGVYAADLSFVLDQLERLEAGGLTSPSVALAGRLDLARVGVFGHSTGGGAAVLMCAQDARCRAGAGLDAWLLPVPDTTLAAGLDQPFLFLWSEVWSTARNDARFATLAPNLRGDYLSATVLGTRHYDFTLVPLLSPLAPALGLKGPLDGTRGMRIVDDYLVAFFDQALQGQPAALLAGPSDAYPEVVYELP